MRERMSLNTRAHVPQQWGYKLRLLAAGWGFAAGALQEVQRTGPQTWQQQAAKGRAQAVPRSARRILQEMDQAG